MTTTAHFGYSAFWTGAERFLAVCGGAAVTYCLIAWGQSSFAQWQGEDEMLSRAAIHSAVPRKIPEGGVVARIEIPRMKFRAIAFEGTSNATLAKGVGHFAGSSLPDAKGNIVFAAHRDTFFAPLENIRRGDMIEVSTARKTLRYRVEEIKVVDPASMEVVQPTATPMLTLITCYPFSYLGAAPQRFVVRAAGLAELE